MRNHIVKFKLEIQVWVLSSKIKRNSSSYLGLYNQHKK